MIVSKLSWHWSLMQSHFSLSLLCVSISLYSFPSFFLPLFSLSFLPSVSTRFELAYTHTMYYLAQVYKNLGESDLVEFICFFLFFFNLLKVITKAFCLPGQTERAATYCHSTLQRQLQLNQYNPMEWALNAATLSQYYITKVGLSYFNWLKTVDLKPFLWIHILFHHLLITQLSPILKCLLLFDCNKHIYFVHHCGSGGSFSVQVMRRVRDF